MWHPNACVAGSTVVPRWSPNFFRQVTSPVAAISHRARYILSCITGWTLKIFPQLSFTSLKIPGAVPRLFIEAFAEYSLLLTNWWVCLWYCIMVKLFSRASFLSRSLMDWNLVLLLYIYQEDLSNTKRCVFDRSSCMLGGNDIKFADDSKYLVIGRFLFHIFIFPLS